MFYDGKILVGDADGERIFIEPKMANRHGLIAGATGTGKTISLKVLAESFSDAGVPVFLADVKGDLSGMCVPGTDSEDMQKRIERFRLAECGFDYHSYPVTFWDIYGEMGIPLRTTVSEMGPLLLARLLGLNETQSNILTIVFSIADKEELMLIDTKDLKSMLNYVSDHSAEYSQEYGNIAKSSIGAILRGVVALEAKGGEQFFGEPGLNIADWFQTGENGRGMINILDCRVLMQDTSMYATFLLWMMSELFEVLPEVGDPEKPRMVFFFDEAHLLFKDISRAFLNKIEQVVKLIRSKGVGIYFITQSPKDIPDEVLSQLGNKVQHALRAYTPSDQKAVRAAAASFRENPAFNTAETLMSLGTGEALISVLDNKGIPGIVMNSKVLPPQSLMGPISDEAKRQHFLSSNLYLKYKDSHDPDSAYEILERLNEKEALEAEEEKRRLAEEKQRIKEEEAARRQKEKEEAAARRAKEREEAAEARRKAKEEEAAARAEQREKEKKAQAMKTGAGRVASTVGGTLGREVGKTVGNTIGGKFGKTLGGNLGAALGRNGLGILFKK